ncbi:MAG TPA: N-6 DNA methylase [Stellaceae bacterium]|nr:N-6 DNA methylase [Stellaceae bacterium]
MARRAPRVAAADEPLPIALFVLFVALLLHVRDTAAASFAARGSSPWRSFLQAEWRTRTRAPVVPLAASVLRALPHGDATEALLARLAAAAEAVTRAGALGGRDFLGRLYRKLVLGAAGPHYATYYTSVPAARLLADLTLPAAPRADISLIDPACGSGTLLAAAQGALDEKGAAEARLCGWDVMPFAAELAGATLVLSGSAAHGRHARIRALPVGDSRSGVRLGSLDVLRRRAPPPTHDIVLMNPPFSRSAKPNRTFGYSAAAERLRLQEALGDLARARGLSGIGRAGLGPYFMLLGLELLGAEGQIGIVVPRSMLSGVSWRKIRARYLDECEIRWIVGNFDPGAPGLEPWNWSENTAIGEVLVVAARTEKPQPARSTLFLNVLRKPRSDGEAAALARAAMAAEAGLPPADEGARALVVEGARVAMLSRVPQAELRRNWLAPAVFATPALNHFALAVLGQDGLAPFGELVNAIGPDIAQVKRAFAAPGRGRDALPLVLGHQGDMATMALAARKLARGAPKAANARALHQRYAARLLVAERPHLGTEALLAMRAPRPVLATAFWEIRPRETSGEAPILVWLNSTYGILAYLAHATSSMGDIVKMKKEQLVAMPAPHAARLDPAACADLVRTLARAPFLPFGAEFARAAAGAGPRLMLDRFLAERLGLPPLDAALYRALARDPVVSGERI